MQCRLYSLHPESHFLADHWLCTTIEKKAQCRITKGHRVLSDDKSFWVSTQDTKELLRSPGARTEQMSSDRRASN